MSFTTSLWRVEGSQLTPVTKSRLDNERQLEDWIVADPSLLGRDLLIFGRQTRTLGGPLDLLAIDSEGEIVIVELKRDRTPREVVAQVLDYASWIRQLEYDQLDQICQDFRKLSLVEAFQAHFSFRIPETTGARHSMLVVASELDDSSERIVQYLQDEHDVNINAVFFTTFEFQGERVLARSWLADPEETTERIEAKRKRPWSGLWFVNNGVDETGRRDWESCRKYGFVSAGGGSRYSEPLKKLSIGDQIVAYQKGRGYVGYGVVTSQALPATQFQLSNGKSLTDTLPRFDPNANDSERRELAVGVNWRLTVPEDQGKKFPGVFANQNIVCKLRDEATIDFLKREFSIA